jgi:hypothetical protein
MENNSFFQGFYILQLLLRCLFFQAKVKLYIPSTINILKKGLTKAINVT